MIRYTFERAAAGSKPVWGEVRLPDTPPARSAIITIHGFKGFKDWGFWPFVCDRLSAAGHAVISFNFSGSGVRQGDSDIADAEAFASSTLTAQQDELAGLVDAVLDSDLLPRRPRTLGLLGHSGGGGAAVIEAGARGRVDALATWAAVSTFHRWGEETRQVWQENGRVYVMNRRTGQQLSLNTAFQEDFDVNRERLDVLGQAARVKAPWLIVQGLEDLTVPPDEAKSLARAAGDARLVLIEGADHELGVTHPWPGESNAHLSEALDATLRHFARHL